MKKNKNIFNNILMQNSVFSSPDFKKKLFFCFCIYFVAFLAILQADYIYGYDVQLLSNTSILSVSGISPINKILSFLLFTGEKVQDISPIPQLMGMLLLAISSVILVLIFCSELTWFRVALATGLGLTPYFLPHMCSKFNSLFECFCVFLAVIPFIFSKRKTFIAVSAVALAIISLLYFPAISIFLVVLSFKLIQSSISKASQKRQFFWIPLVSMAFLALIILNLKGRFVEALRKLFDYYLTYWGHNFLGITFSIIFLSFVLYLFISFVRAMRTGKLLYGDSFVLCLYSILLIIASSSVVQTFSLKEFSFAFGCVLSCMLLLMSEINQTLPKMFIKIIGCFFVWQLIVFGNKFGNLLIAQKQYEKLSFEMVNEVITSRHIDYVSVGPKKMQIPLVPFKGEEYPILNDLIFFDLSHPVYFYDYMNFFLDARIKPCTSKVKTSPTTVLFETDYLKFEQINPQCVELDVKK